MDVHGQRTGFTLRVSQRPAGTVPPPTPSLYMKKMKVHEKKTSCSQSDTGRRTPVWAEPARVPCSCPQTLPHPQGLSWSKAPRDAHQPPRLQEASMDLSRHGTRRRDARGDLEHIPGVGSPAGATQPRQRWKTRAGPGIFCRTALG